MTATIGTDGPDVLVGSSLVQGLGGDDTLTAHDSSTTLDGGAGDDLLQASQFYPGGYASYAEASGPVHVILSQAGPQNVGADQGTDTLVKLSGLIGSEYGDTLSAGSSPGTQIHGGGGADSIVGGAGESYILGDAGDDTLDASAGGLAFGGAGNDVLYLSGQAGLGFDSGGDGDDRIYNGVYADGGNGSDTVSGAHTTSHFSTLQGGAGDDSLVGVSSGTTFYGDDGHNTIVGVGGRDAIFVFDTTVEDTTAYRQDIVHEAGTDNILALWAAPANMRAVVDLGAGTAYVDFVSGSTTSRVADVTFDHIDTVWGTRGADLIVGSASDDSIEGRAGANTLFGGDGDDYIAGGADHNQINGNKGADTIVGSSTVGDWLLGGQGDDSITASSAANIVNGNIGNDTISGDFGATVGSTLRGGQGDDVIQGGGGGDLILGDLGQNTLTGGGGADIFHAGPGHDVVTDFRAGEGDHVLVDPSVTWRAAQSSADVVITFSNGGDMVLQGVQLSGLPSGWIGHV